MTVRRWLAVLLSVLVLAGTVQAQDTPRKAVARTSPGYPELARKLHLTGTVKLEVTVSPTGAVTSAKFVGGNPVFESAALEAVKKWKFESAPSSTVELVSIEFAEKSAK